MCSFYAFSHVEGFCQQHGIYISDWDETLYSCLEHYLPLEYMKICSFLAASTSHLGLFWPIMVYILNIVTITKAYTLEIYTQPHQSKIYIELHILSNFQGKWIDIDNKIIFCLFSLCRGYDTTSYTTPIGTRHVHHPSQIRPVNQKYIYKVCFKIKNKDPTIFLLLIFLLGRDFKILSKNAYNTTYKNIKLKTYYKKIYIQS